MPKFREYFSESSFYLVHYDLYQPIVQKIAPFLVKNGITPNQISIARLILVLSITCFLYYIRNHKLTDGQKKTLVAVLFVLFIICGISDDLDGYIARKYNMKSSLGAKLDNIADFTSFCCMLFIVSVYTGKPQIVIPLGLALIAYQGVEKKLFFANGKQLSPVMNVLTHTWIVYGLVVGALILTR